MAIKSHWQHPAVPNKSGDWISTSDAGARKITQANQRFQDSEHNIGRWSTYTFQSLLRTARGLLG